VSEENSYKGFINPVFHQILTKCKSFTLLKIEHSNFMVIVILCLLKGSSNIEDKHGKLLEELNLRKIMVVSLLIRKDLLRDWCWCWCSLTMSVYTEGPPPSWQSICKWSRDGEQLAVATAFCSSLVSKNVTVLCWLSQQIHFQQLPDFITPITTERLENIDNRLIIWQNMQNEQGV